MSPHSLLSGTPTLDAQAAASLAERFFGRGGAVTSLPSERDQNFLVRPETGPAFVLKVGNAMEDPDLVDMQRRVLSHLAEAGLPVPGVLEARSGDDGVWAESDAGRHPVWAIEYLPGTPLAAQRRRSPELFADLGRRTAQLGEALASFDHPALHRDFHWDLASAEGILDRHLGDIVDSLHRAHVEVARDRYSDLVKPRLLDLPRGAIHNDLNDHNVLVGDVGGADPAAPIDLYARRQRITGLVDFGDMVHGYKIGDLAVALAYALFDQPDPLSAATAAVRGYASVRRPEEAELASLFGLLGLRLSLSACHAAHQQKERPDDPYLSVSQRPLRRLLPRLLEIPPDLAEIAFRSACGLDPSPRTTALETWLRRQETAPLVSTDLAAAEILDLGPASPLIEEDPSQWKPGPPRDFDGLAVGRYGETRMRGPAPASEVATLGATTPDTGRPIDSKADPLENSFAPRRTAFLGLDLWTEAGTPIFAPAAGTLRRDGQAVELLLSGAPSPLRLRLQGLSCHGAEEAPETSVRPGQKIGETEAATHDDEKGRLRLHLLADGPGFQGAPPDFSLPEHFGPWSRLCLDPNLLVRLPAVLFPPTPASAGGALAARRRSLGPSLRLSYRHPVHMARGWRQYLWDSDGRRYLDAYNNVPHVGHCHPQVVEAAIGQMSRLNTNTRYLHDTVNAYAERLASLFPDPLEVCFFVNSATEANDLALRMARAATGHRHVLVQEAAYHGHTTTLVDISPYKHAGPGGEGAPSWVSTVPIPDVYRGPYGADDPEAGRRYARSVVELIDELGESGIRPSAFIAETCPSVGGQILMPAGYLEEVYAAVRGAGGLTLADEVQTGLGRLGTHLWAFEAHGVVPDVVVLGKPIGNGHPLAALVTTRAIAEAFDTGMEFFSTFGGNTVSCAVGLAVLDVLEAEGLQAHALDVGDHLLSGLRRLQERHPLIGDARGSGFFLGIELVRDRNTREPAGTEASFLTSRLRDLGVLVGTEGPHHNVLKVRPPMPFNHADADALLAILDQALREDFS